MQQEVKLQQLANIRTVVSMRVPNLSLAYPFSISTDEHVGYP